MRILLVDSGVYKGSEPAHMLGMYHLLKRSRHRVKLLSHPSPKSLATTVQGFKPDFVGFTAYQEHPPFNLLRPPEQQARTIDLLQGYAEIIKGLKKKDTRIGIGGWGATLNPDYFAKTYHPDVLVKGLGELPMSALSKVDFNPRELEHEGLYRGSIDDTAILQVSDDEEWVKVSFERPYSLTRFKNEARVIVQIGCFGRCIFCSEDRQVRYRPLEYTLEELRYVIQRGANDIRLGGPNFTADPNRASQLVDAINQQNFSPEIFRIVSRLDSLYTSIEKSPEAWVRFLSSNTVEFDIGVESFIPERTLSLRKYPSLGQARKAAQHLQGLARLTSELPFVMKFSWILFWPQGTLEEAKEEINHAIDFLSISPTCVNLSSGIIFNTLRNDASNIPISPCGVSDERYALLIIWSLHHYYNYILPNVEKTKEWPCQNSVEWLRRALKFIEHLEKQTFKRDEKGNVIHAVEIAPGFTPVLKVIDGRVFWVDGINTSSILKLF